MDNRFDEVAPVYTLNLTYLVDDSGSMTGERINQLNVAMHTALIAAEKAAKKTESDLRVRIIKIGSTSDFIVGDPSSGLDHVDWVPLSASSGGTDTAGAIRKAREIMHTSNLGTRNLKPVVILITDGGSNDPTETERAVDELRASLSGSNSEVKKDKIIRIAIGVQDAVRSELEYFASIGNIVDEMGNTQENVPLVFDVDRIDLLSQLLEAVTVSSIVSASNAGAADGDGESEPPIIVHETTEEDDGWEDE